MNKVLSEDRIVLYDVVENKITQNIEPYRRKDYVIRRCSDGLFFKANLLVSGTNYEAAPWHEVFYNQKTKEYE
jgi:hypothetical protein